MSDSPTFSGLQLDGVYPITNASFEHITVSDSTKNNFLNYAPKLLFTITFGDGNAGWQFP